MAAKGARDEPPFTFVVELVLPEMLAVMLE